MFCQDRINQLQAKAFMQIVFKICKQFSLSTNSQPNSKMSGGYFREGSLEDCHHFPQQRLIHGEDFVIIGQCIRRKLYWSQYKCSTAQEGQPLPINSDLQNMQKSISDG